MIRGFAPIAAPDARVLILGTAPSRRSLEEGRYYAHPRNAFWRIMERLFAGGASLGDAARVRLLEANGVAVWDVLHAAEREGSLDASIVGDSAVPNDIAGFLRDHREVRAVFLNGGVAARLFDKLIVPTIRQPAGLRPERLPSTSPAHASMSFEEKLAAWSVVAAAAEPAAAEAAAAEPAP
jgi:double-stranded uracil-DNA glycosylase